MLLNDIQSVEFCHDWLFLKLTRDHSSWYFFLEKHREALFLSVSHDKKCTVNSKKYYLCYKDYSTIDSKSLHFESEMSDSYVFQNHLGWSESTLRFVQHNIGFIKYHNSRTNIYMPACFLTKMAAIGKNDGSEIEQNKL